MGTDTSKPEDVWRKGSTHVQGKYLLPSIHMHERYNITSHIPKPTAFSSSIGSADPNRQSPSNEKGQGYIDALEGTNPVYGPYLNADRMMFQVYALSTMRYVPLRARAGAVYHTSLFVQHKRFSYNSVSIAGVHSMSLSTDAGSSVRVRLIEYPCIGEGVHLWRLHASVDVQCKPQVIVRCHHEPCV